MLAGMQRNEGPRPHPLFLKHILRKLFLEDWPMKLVALVITLALWLGVTGLSTPTTKRLTVPLNLSVSNDAEITNAPIQEVDIVISGDKRKIDQINRAELGASVDLTDVAAGDRVLSLTPDTVAVALPLGVRLEEVQPSRIAVRIEAVEEKDTPVKAETAGEPAAGFEVYGESVTPQKVRVRGPASLIRTLDFVHTEKIDVGGATQDLYVRQLPVSAPNPKAAVLNTVVDVAVRVGEKRIEKRFTVSSAGRTVTAILFGPRSQLERLKPDDLRADITRSDSGDDTPHITLPAAFEDSVEVRSVKASPR